jgi:hypothetical protein
MVSLAFSNILEVEDKTRRLGCIAQGMQRGGCACQMFDGSPSALPTSPRPRVCRPDAIFQLQRPIACATGHGIARRLRYYLTRLCFVLRRVSPDPAILPWRPQRPQRPQPATGSLR